MTFQFKSPLGCHSTNYGSVAHEEIASETESLEVNQTRDLKCWWTDKKIKTELNLQWIITFHFPTKKAGYTFICGFAYNVQVHEKTNMDDITKLLIESFKKIPPLDKEDEFGFLPVLTPLTEQEIEEKHLPYLREQQIFSPTHE